MRNNSEDYHRTHATKLTDYLYLAAARSVTSKCLLDLGITSIVNATLELPTVAYQKQETIQIAVEDRVSSKLYVYFDLIADKIQHVELTGGKILVYCRAGMSRSASLCIAFFMKYHGLSFDAAFMYVKDRRPIIHPNIGFLRQLRDYEQKLHTKPATITRTPSFGKTAGALSIPRIPLPSYAEDITEEDILFHSVEEFPVTRTRPRRTKAKVVVSGPMDCVAEKMEVFPVSQPHEWHESTATSSRLIVERAAVGVADFGGVSIADVSNQTSMDQVSPFDPALRRSKRRTPFTKLTKPNELPVSWIILPLDLAFDNNSRKGFKLQINKEHPLSVISELLKVCSISQEVLHECIPEVSKAPVIDLVDKATKTIQMCSYQIPTASQQTIWECVKLTEIRDNKQVQAEKPPLLRKCSKTKKENDPKNVRLKNIPNVGRKTKNETSLYKLDKKPAAEVKSEMSTSIRAFIHNHELIVQPLENLDACPPNSQSSLQNDKNVSGISVAIRACIPTQGLFVQAFENLDIFSPNVQLSSINLRQRLSISFTVYENALVTKSEQRTLELEILDPPKKYEQFKREYPYYSMVKYNKATDLCRAVKREKVETNYNLVSKKVSNTPASVPLIRKKIGTTSKKSSIGQICRQLEWSTERKLVDEAHYEIPKSLDQVKLCFASTSWSSESNACLQYEPMIYYKLSLVGRFYVPHYNPLLLRGDPEVFWCPVAAVFEPKCFESAGLSIVSKLSTSAHVARATVYEQWRGIATTNINDVRKHEDSSEDIPTEIFDINDMKDLVHSNPKKCELWMNVFKRTLIQQKPTYAGFSFVQSLSTATTSLPTKLCSIDSVIDEPYPKYQVAEIKTESFILTPFALDTFELIIHEPYNDFSDIGNINYTLESFVAAETSDLINEYTINDLSMQMENVKYIPQNMEYNPITNKYHSFQCTTMVSFPNRIPTRLQETIFGTTKEYKTLGTFERYPFRIVSKFKEITDKSMIDLFEASDNLPNYEFVQDIEDQADVVVAIEPEKIKADLVTVDTFWYFAIASEDKEIKLENNDSSDANFLLFLPDPEDADRLGIESDVFPDGTGEVPPIVPNMEVVIHIIKDEMEAQVLEDKLATEVTEAKEPSPDLDLNNFSLRSPRSRRGTNDRKVNFDMDSSKMEMSKSTKPRVKTIYYGRDRSKSRHRLSDAQKESRDKDKSKSKSRFVLQKDQKDYPSKDNGKFHPHEKFTSTDETEVLNNLSTSIASSSIILQKRREEGSLSMAGGLHEERGRSSISSISGTTNKHDNSNISERNQESDGEPAGLMALLNVAQNWFGGKSRREQSKDRAKSLVKKCKRTS